MNQQTGEALILLILVNLILATIVFGITYGGHLQDQKVLDCINSGKDPQACSCAIRGSFGGTQSNCN